MNGRLYDPLLRRFLNADENIQDPYNTQNYNKYGYVLNNPLLYSDPSGEFIFAFVAAWGLSALWGTVATGAIIGAGIGLLTYTLSAALTGQKWSLGGAFKSMFWGAVSGAVTAGIGNIFSVAGEATQFANSLGELGTAMVQGTCHAIAQGTLSLMQGGTFQQVFVSAALGSLAASGFGKIARDWAGKAGGQIFFGAISGGVGAELTGGNFWQGALIGGVVAGLNHAMHEIGNKPDPKRKIAISEELRKRLENGSKATSAMEVLAEMTKEGLITAREAMALSEKIGTFKQFSKDFKFVKNVGKGLGWFSNVATGASVFMDMNDYRNGDISGAVLAYRTTGNIVSYGAGAVTGSPTVGLGMSYIFSSGEKLLNRIATEMTRINNSNGYFLNFIHP